MAGPARTWFARTIKVIEESDAGIIRLDFINHVWECTVIFGRDVQTLTGQGATANEALQDAYRKINTFS